MCVLCRFLQDMETEAEFALGWECVQCCVHDSEQAIFPSIAHLICRMETLTFNLLTVFLFRIYNFSKTLVLKEKKLLQKLFIISLDFCCVCIY